MVGHPFFQIPIAFHFFIKITSHPHLEGEGEEEKIFLTTTVTIWILDYFGIQMGESCPVCEWSGIQMAFEYWTKKSGFSMVRLRHYHFMSCKCHSYVVPFEIRTGFQMFQPFEGWTLKARYSDDSGIQVLIFRWLLYPHCI